MMNSVSRPRRKGRRGALALAVGGALSGGLFLLPFLAEGQTPPLYWQCVAPSPSKPQGSFCPVSTKYPVPFLQTFGGVVTPIVKSDTVFYSPPFRAIYNGNGSACDIAVVMAGDASNTPVTLKAVAPGVVLGVVVSQVLNANTSCSNLDGIY